MRDLDRLTDRELEVLRLLATGRGYVVIARELGISRKTVGAHIKSIFQKLYVCNKTQAVHVAHMQGIIVLEQIPKYEEVGQKT